MKFSLASRTLAGIVLTLVLAGSATAQQPTPPPLESDTIEALQSSVSRLKEKIEQSGQALAQDREKIKSLESNISTAGKATEEMISRFKEMADQFAAGADYHNTLKRAQDDLLEKIERFRNGSEVQRNVSKELEDIRKNFSELDVRRDKALQTALKEIRRLEANKGDIEALIVLKNYKELQTVMNTMISAFEATVAEAKGVNDQVAKAAGITE